MDCSWGQGNNACDGGEDFRAYNWIMKHGLPTEEAYGPYLAQVVIDWRHVISSACETRIVGRPTSL